MKPRGVYNGAITFAPFVTRSDRKCMRLLTNMAGNASSFLSVHCPNVSDELRHQLHCIRFESKGLGGFRCVDCKDYLRETDQETDQVS